MRKFRRLLCQLTTAGVFVCCAGADVLYDFNYTATSGPIHSFSFSITSFSFITAGAPTFTPFKLTDGTTTWTMADDAANQGCIVFTTAAGGPPVAPSTGGCGFNTNTSDEGGFWFILSSLASFGSFSSSNSFGQFYTSSDVPEYFSTFNFSGVTQVTGEFQVNVTSIPEPASAALALSWLSTLAWLVRRRVFRS